MTPAKTRRTPLTECQKANRELVRVLFKRSNQLEDLRNAAENALRHFETKGNRGWKMFRDLRKALEAAK